MRKACIEGSGSLEIFTASLGVRGGAKSLRGRGTYSKYPDTR